VLLNKVDLSKSNARLVWGRSPRKDTVSPTATKTAIGATKRAAPFDMLL